MKQIVEHIVNKEHTKANELIEQHIGNILESKLNEVKKMIAARIDEQIIVQSDGMAHTASGEEILPSVYRARRQLAEGKWSKKVDTKKDSPREVVRKKISAKRAARPAPEMPDERYTELVKKGEERITKRKLRIKNTEERKKAAEEDAKRKAKEAKMAEINRAAEEILRRSGLSARQAVEIIKGGKVSTTKPTMTDYDYAENIRKNPARGIGEKDKPAKKRGLLKRILGIKEEALARAKSILETKALDQAKSDIEALGSKKYKSPMPKATEPKIDAAAIRNYLDDYVKTARAQAATARERAATARERAARKKKPK
jgi:hypothetical protein